MGRTVYITLIGRRSRFFAGARYLKRGANQFVSDEASRKAFKCPPLAKSHPGTDHAPGSRRQRGGDRAVRLGVWLITWGDVANLLTGPCRIVSEPSTSPFHAPLPRYSKGGAQATWPNPNYTSYVQYRGRYESSSAPRRLRTYAHIVQFDRPCLSIPLLWTQTPGGSQFRPPIESARLVSPRKVAL